MKEILKTDNLCKYFKKQKAVDNVSITVRENSIYGLLGPNGAGKSTTLKMITGMLRPTSGKVLFNGHEWNRKDLEQIGALIETPPLYENLSAVENLEVRAKLLGVPKARIDEVLEIVDLQNTGRKKAGQFSMGMKQRLGLALALINNPDLLILDEPLNGLDPQGIAELRETLRHLNKKYGITMVISSHILDELEMIATRYGFIHKGHMIEEITVDELHEKLKKYISLDVENISLATITIEQKLNTVNYKVVNDHTIYLYDYVNDGAKVASTLIKEGVMIEKMNVSNMSLENYYFSLIKGVENNV